MQGQADNQEKAFFDKETAKLFIEKTVANIPENIRDYVNSNEDIISLQNGDVLLSLADDEAYNGNFQFALWCIYISYYISDIADLPPLKARAGRLAADLFLHLSYYGEAYKWGNIALSAYEQTNEFESQVETCLVLLDCLFSDSAVQVENIRAVFDTAFLAAEHCPASVHYLSLLLTYADFQYNSGGSPEEVARIYEQALEFINDSSSNISPLTYFNTILNLCDVFITENAQFNSTKIIALITEALKKAEYLKIIFFQLCIYDKLSGFYYAAGKSTACLKSVDQLMILYKREEWREEQEKMGINERVFLHVFADKGYMKSLIYAAQAADEVRQYDRGLNYCLDVLKLCKLNGKEADRIKFMAEIKRFELFISAEQDIQADENYKAAKVTFDQLPPDIQKVHSSLVVNTDEVYNALFTTDLSPKEIRLLASKYRQILKTTGIVRRLLNKAYSSSVAASNDIEELLALEQLLKMDADSGDSINWIENMHRFYATINEKKIFERGLYIFPEGSTIKLPEPEDIEDLREAFENLRNLFNEPGTGEKEVTRPNFMLSSLVNFKNAFPVEQFALLFFNAHQIDEKLIIELLSRETGAASDSRLVRLGEYQSSKQLLESLPRFDLVQYQNACLADYALKLNAKCVSDEMQQLAKALIAARFCKMYTMLGLEKLRAHWWNLSASLTLKMSVQTYQDNALLSKAVQILASLANRGAKQDIYSAEILMIKDKGIEDSLSKQFAQIIEALDSTDYYENIKRVDNAWESTSISLNADEKEKAKVFLHLLKGHIYRNADKYDLALEHYQIAHMNAAMVNNIHYLAMASSAIATIYRNVNQMDKAVSYLNEAISLSYLGEDDEFRAIKHFDLGFLLFETGDTDMASYHLGEVIRLSTSQSGPTYNKANCMLSFISLHKKYKIAFSNNDQFVLADKNSEDSEISSFISKVETAIEISISYSAISDTGLYYRLLSQVYKLRNLGKAYSYASLALDFYRTQKEPERRKIILTSYLKLEIIEYQFRYDNENFSNQLDEYIAITKNILSELTQLKIGYGQENFQIGFMASHEYNFKRCLKVLMLWAATEPLEDNELWNVYHLAQIIKADILNQEITLRNQQLSGNTLLAKETELLFSIQDKAKMLEIEQLKPADLIDRLLVENLNAKIDGQRIELQQIRNQIDALRFEAVGKYFERDGVESYFLKDKQLAFLDFFVMDERFFCWFIKSGEIRVFTGILPLSQLNHHLEQIKNPDCAIETDFIKNGLTIFDELIGQHKLELSNVQRLKIIPHDLLYYLPFETLITKFDENGFCWFLEHPAGISYAYSINTFLILNKVTQKIAEPKNIFTGFAKSSFSDVDFSGHRRAPDIKHTVDEVNQIGLYFENKNLFLDLECTKTNLTQALLGGTRYLHIATHSMIENGIPEIILTPQNNDGGILSYQDLYMIDGMVDNVTLSACNTANGKTINLEGVIGLVRGFHKLGALNIQASLWFVNDRSTGLFMKQFYHYMLKYTLSPSVALRKVKLFMIGKEQTDYTSKNILLATKYQHPFFWAPFIAVGKD